MDFFSCPLPMISNDCTIGMPEDIMVASWREKNEMSAAVTGGPAPAMANRVEEIMREEGRTRSELLREALRRYIEEQEWRQILRYGEQRSREQGVGPQDVEQLVAEHRAEAS